jgi:arginyl-tRNA synthetase
MTLKGLIEEAVAEAFLKAGLSAETPTRLQWSARPEFGDLQINGVMGAAKQLKTNPRELAEQILNHLPLGQELIASAEIAGPGFINLHLNAQAISSAAELMLSDDRLGVEQPDSPQNIVVDYSSPNLAKEMHVGHLRGTILGDAVCRALEFKGHRVIRQNHIGDWGTQFGMLIAELQQSQTNEQLASGIALSDLEVFYRQAKQHFDADPEFADRARANVVKLQAGDSECLSLWQHFIDESLSHAQQNYEKLGVSLTPEDVCGESAYNADLEQVVSELKERGIASEDQGAQVVYLDELATKDGQPSAVIVQKADGGYLYATSDLAAIRYRVRELKADRCLYFIDARQSLHMKQVYAIGRKTGWAPERVQLEHCAYGTIMGEDGKPFKTRSGDTVKLADLLDEAVQRATAVVAEKNPNLDNVECESIGRAVGIGAIKYADLSKARTTDYRFNWESMLSFEGNTAPYLLYAGTRIHSLFEKAGENLESFQADLRIGDQNERALALTLIRFAEVVDQLVESAMPHELCGYLYELSGKFASFYEACPILKSDVDPIDRQSRLALAALTSRVLENGFGLLGIASLRRM